MTPTPEVPQPRESGQSLGPQSIGPRTPRVIVETITRTWRPITGPVACYCGHLHYGRVFNSVMAADYGHCEDETCSCRCLRRVIKDAQAVES